MNTQTIQSDYLIIGAGIIGLTIARELRERQPDKKIIIIEKESDVALHSSGRNSGVLHAGFYYTADSLKAKFTREGNSAMRNYCKSNGLHINECKKVVVARNAAELPALHELNRRAQSNGVNVQLINLKELAEIEPNAVSYRQALLSPTTATVDPVEVNLCLKNELLAKGIEFYFNDAYIERIGGNTVKTEKHVFSATKLINTAGLYADRVAQNFGFSKNFTIIPFKGIYLKYTGDKQLINTNIYPVPNLKNPFLGVHYTVTVDNHIKIGPTSIPAFWRENYQGISNFHVKELVNILSWEALLFLLNSFGFRNLAIDEVKKYSRKYFVALAQAMVKEMDAERFTEWVRPGIRAQLLNKTTKELVMDFVVEGDADSVHVLNAVSPAFTCSFPFAKWVVENYV
ncbi:MAG: L-2-hydroxyglutarate oxidase [Prevotellaceae bacterium]|nr:L-2-hydroxyglutarate oxidase [Prevotellaceae bacterium]